MNHIRRHRKFPLTLSRDELEGLYRDAYSRMEEIFETCIGIRRQIYYSVEDLKDNLNELDEILFYIHNAKLSQEIPDITDLYEPEQDEELPFV